MRPKMGHIFKTFRSKLVAIYYILSVGITRQMRWPNEVDSRSFPLVKMNLEYLLLYYLQSSSYQINVEPPRGCL